MILGYMKVKQDEAYKKEKKKSCKRKLYWLLFFVYEIDGTGMKELRDVKEKYDLFLMLYEQGVKKYTPIYKVEVKEWFNEKCVLTTTKKRQSMDENEN